MLSKIYRKLLNARKRLFRYASIQLAIQVIGGVVGFLTVNHLEKKEMALLTIALSGLTTVSLFSDSGLGSAMSAIAGECHTDPPSLAKKLSWFRKTRLLFFLLSMLLVGPVTTWLMVTNDSSSFRILLCLIFLVVTAFFTVQFAPFSFALKINGQVNRLGAVEFIGVLVRFLAIGIGIAVPVLFFEFALLGMFGAAIVQYMLYAKWQNIPTSGELDEREKERVVSIVKSSIPLVIFSCVQGQIVTMILSLKGNLDYVADFGALSRFLIAFSICSLPIQHFLIPRVARSRFPTEVRRAAIETIFIAVPLLLMCWIVLVCLTPWLLILVGPNYANLDTAFIMFMFTSFIAAVGNVIWGVVLAKGWVKHGWLQLPLTLSGLIIAIPLLSFHGHVWPILFGAIPSLVSLVFGFSLFMANLPARERGSFSSVR